MTEEAFTPTAVPAGVPTQPPPGHARPAVPPSYARPAVPPSYGGPPGYHPPPPALSPTGQPLASFSDRLLAYLIDTGIFCLVGIFLAIPVVILVLAVIIPDLTEVGPDGTIAEPDFLDVFLSILFIQAGVLLISLVLSYLYHVEMMFRTGQTYGKKIMKIKVVPLNPAVALGRGAAVKRFLVTLASGLVPGLNYLDGLWQLWDKPYQQCLHDKFAQTVVVKVPA